MKKETQAEDLGMWVVMGMLLVLCSIGISTIFGWMFNPLAQKEDAEAPVFRFESVVTGKFCGAFGCDSDPYALASVNKEECSIYASSTKNILTGTGKCWVAHIRRTSAGMDGLVRPYVFPYETSASTIAENINQYVKKANEQDAIDKEKRERDERDENEMMQKVQDILKH